MKYQNVLPKTFYINLIYECPKCKDEKWLDRKEISHKMTVVCDSCGEVYQTLPVEISRVSYRPVQSEPIFQPNPRPVSDHLVDWICSYGYNRRDAQNVLSTLDEKLEDKERLRRALSLLSKDYVNVSS